MVHVGGTVPRPCQHRIARSTANAEARQLLPNASSPSETLSVSACWVLQDRGTSNDRGSARQENFLATCTRTPNKKDPLACRLQKVQRRRYLTLRSAKKRHIACPLCNSMSNCSRWRAAALPWLPWHGGALECLRAGLAAESLGIDD